MKRKIIVTFVRFLLLCLLVIVTSSCDLSNRRQHDVQDIPKDAPMTEFLLGSWTSEHAYDSEGRESSYKYELEVVDENTLKFVVLSLEGDFLEGATSQYRFTETNTIFIDNKRIQGGELWFLEREGQNLIVHRTIADKTDRIVFARMENN